MDCGTSLVKYILFLFNILCSVCGIILIAFGVILLGNISHVKGDYDSHIIPVGLIVLGGVILIISFFGCCGAIRESYCMSMTYAFFLLVLLIIQIVCISWVWANKDKFLNGMGKIVDQAWDERARDISAMDAFQAGFQCCGRNGPLDYGINIPSSCCKNNSCSNPINIYLTGCRSAFVNFWDSNSDYAKYIGLGVVGVELVGFIFACCLANNIRNYRRRTEY